MFSIALQRKIKVQDFKPYRLQFPFKDSSCLTRSTPTILKEMSKMHEEDAHDDNLIAMQTSNQIHTRNRMRAAENSANSHILETADLNDDANAPLHMHTNNDDANAPLHVHNDTPAVLATIEARENSTLLPTILPPRATSDNDLAAARPFVEHDEAVESIYTQTWPIIANSKSQKHWHIILWRLVSQNSTPQTTWYQRASCASLESRPKKSHLRKLS